MVHAIELMADAAAADEEASREAAEVDAERKAVDAMPESPAKEAAMQKLADDEAHAQQIAEEALVREMAAEKFRKLDFADVGAEDIITSGYAAARYLIAQDWRTPARFSAMVVGSSGITDELALASVHTVAPEPEQEPMPTTVDATTFASWDPDPQVGAVVVGMDTALTYRRLAKAALALQDPKCLFVATNMDAADNVGGAERLRLMPGAGAAVGALRGCTGREPVNCGKGGEWILQMMREEFSLVPHKTLIVGDRLDTDIAFGFAAGMRTALPLTGVTTAQMLAELPTDSVRPDFVLPSIASITLRADA